MKYLKNVEAAIRWKAERIRQRQAFPIIARWHKRDCPKRCLAGTALKALLSKFGINADEKGCKCKSRAARMDASGCDWCEANIEEIVGWLREEATRRGLPFLDAAGRLLVRRAIANARRAQK